MPTKKFVIIDANSLIHRSFHALPPLTTKEGKLVNAVYGFTVILLKVLKEFKPDYLACCFDVSKDTFRRQAYQAYKAKRPEQPAELYQQFPMIKDLLSAFHIPVYEKEGFEADDLIGTLVHQTKILTTKHKGRDLKNIVVSGDLDTLQLINPQTEVCTLKKGITETIVYNEPAVKERFGFGPEKMVDYKALRGDPSDNIPGVKGIGEKTALALIQKFGSLEKIYDFVDRIKDFKKETEKIKAQDLKLSVFQKLKEYRADAFLSQKLARITTDVKVNFKLDDCRVQPFDTEKVVALLRAFDFHSLIGKIPGAEKMMREKQGLLFDSATNKNIVNVSQKIEKIKSDVDYQLIDSTKKLNEFLAELSQQKEFALDTETDGLNPFKNNLLGISFSWQEKTAWYLPVGKSQGAHLDKKSAEFDQLQKILADKKIGKVGHNIKFDWQTLNKFGLKLEGIVFDTMLAAYLLNPGSRQHNLDNLAFAEFGYHTLSIGELTGEKNPQKIDLSKIPVAQVAVYTGEDADLTWRLYRHLSKKMARELKQNVLQKIELPLIPILAEMEEVGIKIDLKFLKKMSQNIGERLKKLEQKIWRLARVKFNVASPKQLKEILFTKLKISSLGLGKTKTGVSTAATELDKLKGRHPIIDLIFEHRELSKLKNTYLEPLPTLADENDRIHTSFNQTVTATGRLSSSEPNLQNIPIRGELGQKIRRAFVAAEGYQIVAADYSQIELRIVASLANDKKMLAAFRKREDIHTQTAAEIFEVKPEKVTGNMRRQAKVVNFGIIYGLGAKGLAESTGLSYEEARDFIEKYFQVYTHLKNYIEKSIAQTRRLGYAETLFGRRRYLPEITAEHQQLRAQAERMAINHPIQGTAADLIKMAMINLDKKIKQTFAPGEVKMLLQIHDELIFEVRHDLVASAKKIIAEEMTAVHQLKAPIEVEISSGKNWGECEK